MLSAIIPAEAGPEALAETLAALVAGVVSGLIKDVTVVDAKGDPALAALCEEGGCRHLTGDGRLLAQAVREARAAHMLLLPAGIVLVDPWLARVRDFFLKGARGALFPARRDDGLARRAVALLRVGKRPPAAILLPRERAAAMPGDSWDAMRRALARRDVPLVFRNCAYEVR